MKTIRNLALAALLSLGISGAAQAQSGCSYIVYGAVLTPGQWNVCFSNKQDTLGYTPVNKAGDTMLGRLTMVQGSTLAASMNVPQGAAPTSPNNGDVWTTSSGMFVRINGVTIGPLSGATASSFAGTSPITVSFPAGVVTYAFDFTVANTFLAQQTNQGATTTSPGWYTQITGDTVPRVRVGLNATDVPSIAFGPGNAVRDAFIERVGAGALRFGAPDAAAPIPQTLSVQNVVAGTSNTAGANATVSGSQGTGTGAGGSIIFKVAPAGSTGSTQNPLLTALTLDASSTAGRATFTSPVTMSAALTYGSVTLSNSVTGTGSMVLGTSPAIASPTLSGTVAGSVTVSGNNTYSGTSLFTGAAFTLTTNGQATIGASATAGGIFAGQGSTSDVTIANKSGTAVANVATGTTVFNAVGFSINGVSVNTATSTTQFAAVKIDGVTITLNGSNQLQSSGVAATNVTVGTTTVTTGTDKFCLYNNAGVLGNQGCIVAVKRQSFCASGCTTTIAGGGSGTYTPSTGTVVAVLECRGGGGAGGGALGSANNTFSAGGGAQGSYGRVVKTIAQIQADGSFASGHVSVNIGAAGTASSNANGGSGGASSIGSGPLVNAPGGGGGIASNAASGASGVAIGGTPGAAGTEGTPGDAGGNGAFFNGGTFGGVVVPSGQGGGEGGGVAVSAVGTALAGNAGTGFGAGGSGASTQNTGLGGVAGGGGFSGGCFATEYTNQ